MKNNRYDYGYAKADQQHRAVAANFKRSSFRFYQKAACENIYKKEDRYDKKQAQRHLPNKSVAVCKKADNG